MAATLEHDTGEPEVPAPTGLEVTDLKVFHGVVPAVRGVSLECKPGEILGIVGPNGAGKTSLLSGIAGTKKASGGQVVLDGKDVSHWPAFRRGQAGIVMVNERKRVFPSLSVRENLAAGAWGLDKSETEARVEQMLDLFPRLRERESVPSFRLSGGEQRMVSIGRALMTGSHCLLLDELSLGLAPRIVAQLTELVRQLADEGRSIVLVEQYVGVLLRLADNVSILERGRVKFHGATHETALWLEEHGYLKHQDVEAVEEGLSI
ncbi:MAG: ATP-binding cassette domain-containing protein [Acidimicrobiia bacterium]